MRIVIVSDLHNHFREITLPDGDVFIDCGDQTRKGELSIIEDYAAWLKGLPHKHKLVIFGNHELGFQIGPKREPAIEMIRKAGAEYLEDSSVEIDDIMFYGSPWQPEFHHWEWNLPRGKALAMKWAEIPEKCNVLITHGPPQGILDDAFGIPAGCQDLLERIVYLSGLGHLRLAASGHIHRDHDEQPIEKFGVKFCNASICNNAYKPLNSPVVIDI